MRGQGRDNAVENGEFRKGDHLTEFKFNLDGSDLPPAPPPIRNSPNPELDQFRRSSFFLTNLRPGPTSEADTYSLAIKGKTTKIPDPPVKQPQVSSEGDAIKIFESRREHSEGIAFSSEQLAAIKLLPRVGLALAHEEDSYNLLKAELPEIKARTEQIMRMIAPRFAEIYEESSLIDLERIPDTVFHTAYHAKESLDPRIPLSENRVVVRSLVSFQSVNSSGTKTFVVPQWDSPAESTFGENFGAADDQVIRSKKFAGLVVTWGIACDEKLVTDQELFSKLKPESGLELRIMSIELFAEGSVIRREAEKLGRNGHGGHFDSLLRASIARGISEKLCSVAATEESKRRGCSVEQLPDELNCLPHELAGRLGVSVGDLSDKGICPSRFEFSYIGHRKAPEGGKEGNPTVDSYSFHTRFPGGEAKVQINWRASDWGCTWGVASLSLDPNELDNSKI